VTLNGRFTFRQYRLFGPGVHCDQTVLFSTDVTLWLVR